MKWLKRLTKRSDSLSEGFLSFSAGERKGLLALLPLLLVAGIVVFVGRRPAGDRNLEMLADARQQADAAGKDAANGWHDYGDRRAARAGTAGRTANTWSAGGRAAYWADDDPGGGTAGGGASDQPRQPAKLFVFDPNTIDLEDLCRLGFTKRDAAGILSYREAGKVFHDRYDFAGCYQVSLEMFKRLENYIVIGEPFRRPARGGQQPGNTAAGEGTGVAQGASGDSARLAECTEQRSAAAPAMVDLNRADSATLCAVRGIGPVTAGRIVALRRRLGGFASLEQLAQVEGVTERNFEMMREEIFASPAGITKIDINFATPAEMVHPYISGTMLRKILKERQLKGGWTSVEDMVKEDIMTPEQAARLAPYLIFTPAAASNKP